MNTRESLDAANALVREIESAKRKARNLHQDAETLRAIRLEEHPGAFFIDRIGARGRAFNESAFLHVESTLDKHRALILRVTEQRLAAEERSVLLGVELAEQRLASMLVEDAETGGEG